MLDVSDVLDVLDVAKLIEGPRHPRLAGEIDSGRRRMVAESVAELGFHEVSGAVIWYATYSAGPKHRLDMT